MGGIILILVILNNLITITTALTSAFFPNPISPSDHTCSRIKMMKYRYVHMLCSSLMWLRKPLCELVAPAAQPRHDQHMLLKI
jgi:hypothetical protein